MAYNKECLVIVLDVRQNAGMEFKQKSIKCSAEILKDKICAAKKDYVTFLLLGTERTSNDLNNDGRPDNYTHIVQYPHAQLATWQLLIEFLKFVNEEACEEGEWLDALVVAMEVLQRSGESFKFQRQRILLFYDFNDTDINYEMFDVITENVLKVDIGLIVVSPNIEYIDNPADDKPQSIFCDAVHKSKQQKENEKYALRLVSSCNAKLCNFTEVLETVFHVANPRPWSWNAKLSIGSKLHISVSGMLAIKDESNVKLKKCWADPEDIVTREWKYFIKNEEVQLLPEDMINAYMLGATPIPYDEPLTGEQEAGASLKFVGFTKRQSIPEEYYCGKALYWVVHKRGQAASARKLDALVRALLKTEMAVLCSKIYSAKISNPKLVVLLPNELRADRPATLSMIELSYHAQHHFWDFPALRTQKTECTPQQLEAIDNLIDAMDLMLDPKEAQLPRTTYQKDLLPFDTLPHIYEQNMMDVLERKVLRTASEDDEQFLEMLADKNFVEVFWKVPELREQQAKHAAKQVKALFPLEKSSKPLEKAKARAILEGRLKPEEDIKGEQLIRPLNVSADIEQVGVLTPAEDFEQLLQQEVLPLKNNLTLRHAKFNVFASQIRNTIWKLLFESSEVAADKIAAALRVYRQSCFDFNGMDDYNTWIAHLKAMVVRQKLFDFWRSVIVQEELGICIVGKPSLDERVSMEQFYSINNNAPEQADLDDSAVDKLSQN